MRFLCRIGWHDWDKRKRELWHGKIRWVRWGVPVTNWEEHTETLFLTRECRACGKHEQKREDL